MLPDTYEECRTFQHWAQQKEHGDAHLLWRCNLDEEDAFPLLRHLWLTATTMNKSGVDIKIIQVYLIIKYHTKRSRIFLERLQNGDPDCQRHFLVHGCVPRIGSHWTGESRKMETCALLLLLGSWNGSRAAMREGQEEKAKEARKSRR